MTKPKRSLTKAKEELLDAKLKKLELMEAERERKYSLPHLYGMKFYPWARAFFESTNKECFISAGNQISKSSTQIRKAIHWATAVDLWPKLWKTTPRIFWYMYPSMNVASSEFLKKWEPEFMPRGKMKDDPVFGWSIGKDRGMISEINFNSGVTIYFKTYTIDPQSLQSSSVHYIALDEEAPHELVPELQSRMYGTEGYLSAVFTPTMGQEFWRKVIECDPPERIFPNSFRQKVSMFSCLLYEDNTPSPWTVDRIKRIEAGCKSPQEVRRRVYGDFVLDSGLKYASFDPAVNVIEPFKIPDDFYYYIGVDMGSGGDNGHPASVIFTAVSPDFKKMYVVDGRRFDGIVTTASDVCSYVIAMKKEIKHEIVATLYDTHAVDLKNIAASMGETWIPAEKSHDVGEHVVNVCFKHQKLSIFRLEQLMPLVQELKSLKADTSKRLAVDDYCDAMRYSLTKIPVDYSDIGSSVPKKSEHQMTALEYEQAERRKLIAPQQEADDWSIENYFDEWADYYD